MAKIETGLHGVGNLLAAGACALVLLFGTAVKGSGATRADAMNDADARATRIARSRGTCITPAKLDECAQASDGTWICTAYVANHQGSCSSSERP